ncbi:MAG: hypothetical protein KDD16_12445 [Mangrovimonas sp.]|nr:hypothetical protein [Mangrovimonas sp.]HRV56189.1 hypothetical protein [Mangrovimonas sp.]
MLFFFGTRATKIGETPIKNTTCNFCSQPDTFKVITFGRYLHFFWIPIFPLFKTQTAECSHCKKTYSENEFSQEMKTAIVKAHELNSPKRPIWHGCGCLLIIAFFVLPMIFGGIYNIFKEDDGSKDINEENDVRAEYLNEELSRVTSSLTIETDSIAYDLKECINLTIEGIETDKIKYATALNKNRLLVLLKVDDMKKIKKSSRKELVYAVEECLDLMEYQNIDEYYIGVDGKWNLLMVKTPYVSDLGGDFADLSDLYTFYDEFENELVRKRNDTLMEVEIQSTE